MGGTALDASGNEVRTTATHKFPLPGPLPGRFVPTFNGNNQYRLPDPKTGELKSFSRATTLAKALDDMYMVHRWNVRKTLLGLAKRDDLNASLMQISYDIESTEITEDDARSSLNRIAEEASSAAGTDHANEHGTAVHDWAAWVDAGLTPLSAVPEMFRYAVWKYLHTLAHRQLIVIPEYTERIVMNSALGTVGTLDRIFLTQRNTSASHPLPALGDLKTSKGLEFSWLAFAIQLAFYQSCDLMLSEDGKTWEPMPALDSDVAFIAHIPSSDPENTAIQPINLDFGREMLNLADTVRKARNRAKKEAPAKFDMAFAPDVNLVRWFTARLAVQTSDSEAQLAELWTEYQDVWTDDLTTLGQRIIAGHNTQGI